MMDEVVEEEVDEVMEEEVEEEVGGLLLYHWSQSFASQKVRLVICEKRLACEEREVCLPLNEHNEPWFMRLNPAGEVPVLVHGKVVVCQADAIVTYLEETFTGDAVPRLLPEAGSPYLARVQHYRELLDSLPVDTYTHGCILHPHLASHGSLPAFATAHIRNQIINTDAELKKLAREHPEMRDLYLGKLRRFKSKLLEQDDLAHVERVLEDLDRVLDQVETELEQRSQESPDTEAGGELWWLCGPAYSLADACLVATLHRLSFLGLSRRRWGPSAQRRPRLAAYYERSARREAFARVLRPADNVLRSALMPAALKAARRHGPRLILRGAAALLAGAAAAALAVLVARVARRRLAAAVAVVVVGNVAGRAG
uniref:Ganglioside-induced differentiation-associated protein 1-like isoform X1 n=1 Tax=Petromyzon marinus TaxID=7757 RepID=A0AAJ7UHB6_PETMA|nr:ganglioside-induced differentiation-associated protein 1-like isoform X1 [Petromyzon marinus]